MQRIRLVGVARRAVIGTCSGSHRALYRGSFRNAFANVVIRLILIEILTLAEASRADRQVGNDMPQLDTEADGGE